MNAAPASKVSDRNIGMTAPSCGLPGAIPGHLAHRASVSQPGAHFYSEPSRRLDKSPNVNGQGGRAVAAMRLHTQGG